MYIERKVDGLSGRLASGASRSRRRARRSESVARKLARDPNPLLAGFPKRAERSAVPPRGLASSEAVQDGVTDGIPFERYRRRSRSPSQLGVLEAAPSNCAVVNPRGVITTIASRPAPVTSA